MEKQESNISKLFIGISIAVLSAIIINKCNLETPIIINYESPKQVAGPLPQKLEKVDISGLYKGFCTNRTYGQSGNLILNLDQEASGKIKGTVNITGNLYGSGDIEGHFRDNKIGFTSKESSTGILISWDGRIQNNQLFGEYVVSVPPYLKAQTGLVDQVGNWKVSR